MILSCFERNPKKLNKPVGHFNKTKIIVINFPRRQMHCVDVTSPKTQLCDARGIVWSVSFIYVVHTVCCIIHRL